MTITPRLRTLAAAAGCLAFLSAPVCEAAEEGNAASVQKAKASRPSVQSVIEARGFPMKEVGEGFVEYEGWTGRPESGTVMAFWKPESRRTAWFALMSYPDDLTVLSQRFKFIRTSGTRFEIDCEGRRLRAIERMRTAAPFLKGEIFDRRILSRSWIRITNGRMDPTAASQIEDGESEIFERTFALACTMPK